jgi:DNA-binding FrmR family transcriptional regulator
MNDDNKKIITSFKKAKSSLERIIDMTEKGRYCIDIMQQNLAVIGLLKSAHHQLLDRHLNTCFKNAMASKDEGVKKKMIKEITQVNKIANK